MLLKAARYFTILKKSKLGLAMSPVGIWNYIQYYFRQRTPEIHPSKLAPVALNLLVTMRCNYHCSFCVVGNNDLQYSRMQAAAADMTSEVAAKIMDLDIAKRSLLVVLSGGEPLLNKNILGIVKEIKKRKKICGIITNGALLPLRLTELLRFGVDDIQLSVYDHSISNLRKTLPGMCKELPLNASYVLLKSVLENSPEKIDEIVELCASAGCNSLKFNICVPNDNGAQETIFDDNEAYATLRSRLHNRKINRTTIFLPKAVSKTICSRKDKKCFIPWQSLLVDNVGRISMCCAYKSLDNAWGGGIF